MTASIAERVRAGATLLDSEVPGWAEKINVEHLQLESCLQCMLGQLFGHFVEGTERLNLNTPALRVGHGFDAYAYCNGADRSNDEIEQEHDALTTAWIAEIHARRNAPRLTAPTPEREAVAV